MADGAHRRPSVGDERGDGAILADLERHELDPRSARLHRLAQRDHPAQGTRVDAGDPHRVAAVALEEGHGGRSQAIRRRTPAFRKPTLEPDRGFIAMKATITAPPSTRPAMRPTPTATPYPAMSSAAATRTRPSNKTPAPRCNGHRRPVCAACAERLRRAATTSVSYRSTRADVVRHSFRGMPRWYCSYRPEEAVLSIYLEIASRDGTSCDPQQRT